MSDVGLIVFSPFFALAAWLSSIKLWNSLKYGKFHWWIELHSRDEMPIRFWLVMLGYVGILATSLYMLGKAFF